MPGLGHFPMSEDPARFLGYLRPVLARILAGSVALSKRAAANSSRRHT